MTASSLRIWSTSRMLRKRAASTTFTATVPGVPASFPAKHTPHFCRASAPRTLHTVVGAPVSKSHLDRVKQSAVQSAETGRAARRYRCGRCQTRQRRARGQA